MGEAKRRKALDPTWGKLRELDQCSDQEILHMFLEARLEVSAQLDALAAKRPDLKIRWYLDGTKRVVESAPGTKPELKILLADLADQCYQRTRRRHGMVPCGKTTPSHIKIMNLPLDPNQNWL